MDQVLEVYSIKRYFIPPYYAHENPVERYNRTLKTIISIFVGENHRTWDKLLPQFRHALNTVRQTTTKISPAIFNFSRHLEPIKSLRRSCENKEQIVQIKEKDWLDRLKKLEESRDLDY